MASAIGQTYDIWRNYYARRNNVSEGARMIERYLYSKNKSVSQKTQKDADILTNFFKQLKDISTEQKKKDSLQRTVSAKILGTYVKNLPVINFALGGNALSMLTEDGDSGGIAFEKEIEKLILEENNNQKITGTSTATAYINLGAKDEKGAEKYAEEVINDEVVSVIENIDKRIVKELDELDIPHFYLKVGAKRTGKIDIWAGDNTEINFLIDGEPTEKFKKAIELLKTSTFSIKSYLGEGAIHLGDTDPQKAVSAVAEYVASKTGYKNYIRAAAIYYIHHPIKGDDKNLIKPEQDFTVDELYSIYNRIKKIYELAGLGLKYDEMDSFKNVDFLLVNRASSEEIKVYSTQELIKKFGSDQYYKFDIY